MLEAVAVGVHGPEEEISVAFIWALLGDPERANEAVSAANTESPLDTLFNIAETPEVRAIIHLDQNKPEDAVRELEQVRPYDLCVAVNLAPGYYRGLAYLRSGQPKRAIAEFQAVLNQRGAAPHSLYIPLSELQWVKILSQAGENDVAFALTKELEEIWKEADSGFPPLRELLLAMKIHRKEGGGVSRQKTGPMPSASEPEADSHVLIRVDMNRDPLESTADARAGNAQTSVNLELREMTAAHERLAVTRQELAGLLVEGQRHMRA